MSEMFTDEEMDYLGTDGLLARVATVGADSTPHVTPVGMWRVADGGVIEVRGRDLATTKKFRDLERTPRAAIVIDDVIPPWRPRGVLVRGRGEAVGGEKPVIRIHPERIVSWGLGTNGDQVGSRNARDVGTR